MKIKTNVRFGFIHVDGFYRKRRANEVLSINS